MSTAGRSFYQLVRALILDQRCNVKEALSAKEDSDSGSDLPHMETEKQYSA